jgi:hypothetical protein
VRIIAGALALIVVASCNAHPPTADEIRDAYAAHLKADPVHEVGMRANTSPAVIPQQEPACSSDGNAHFDCRIRVIYETSAGRHSQEQMVHVRRSGGSWVVDSVN